MSVEIAFRNSVRKSVKTLSESIMDGGFPDEQAKRKWKYENSADWHYGYFVGMIEALASSAYFTFFKTKPDKEKTLEIRDIVEEETKNIREYFKKNYKD